MSDDGAPGFLLVGLMLGAVLTGSICLIAQCDATTHRQRLRSEQACKPAYVLSASDGIAACSDGRVWRWREGYLVPVGKGGGGK